MCEHSVVKLVIVFLEINPNSGIQRGRGGEKNNDGDEIKGHLFLMKYKAL